MINAIHNLFQEILFEISAIALVCLGVALFAAKIVAPSWRIIRKWLSLPKMQAVFVGLLVAGMIHYGATKEGGGGFKSTFTFSNGIVDNKETPSYSTNDTVFISWQKSKSTIIVTNGTPVHIEYRLITNNVEFVELATVAFENSSWTWTVEGATNYNYNVWYDYQGESQYVVNDQWEYKTTTATNKDIIAINGKVQGEDKSLEEPVDLMSPRTNAFEKMKAEVEAQQ